VRVLPAALVHLLTASGAVLAWLATVDVFAGHYRRAFLWLAISTLIDSFDGALARGVRVKEHMPGVDGGRLDDIVDYLTFVFVPALVVARAGLVPAPWVVPVAAAMLVSSAYGFSQVNAKSSDHFFIGFPSYWNIVVLYVVVLRLDPLVNALVLLGLAVLVFVPIGYVYPSRTPTLRALTVLLGSIWGVLVFVIVWTLPDPPRAVVLASLAVPVYYFGLSLVLQARRTTASRSGRVSGVS
jgi:phosphatidylcholine synthase